MFAYARFFEQHPLRVALCVLVALVAFGLGLRRLEFDDEPRSILRSDSAEFALLEDVWRDFGADDNEAAVVLDGGSLFTVDGLSALEHVTAALLEVDGVTRVSSVANVMLMPSLGGGLVPSSILPSAASFAELSPERRAAVEARVLEHSLVHGRLVASNGETALLVAHIDPTITKIDPLTPVVDGIVAAVERTTLATARRARVTGIPSVRVELYRTARYEQALFFSIASVLCAFIAWWLFRDWRSVLVAAVPPFVGTVFAHGAFGWLGWKVDLLGTVIPMLVTVIGFTDAVHLTIHARQKVLEGFTPRAAAADAIRRVGKACMLTSLTTAVGFGSLALGSIETIGRFGEMCAVAMVLAFVAVLTALPLMCVLLLRPGGAETQGVSEHLFRRLTPWIERRAGWIAGVGTLLVLVLAGLSMQLETENHLLEATPSDSPTFSALRDLEEAFGGALPMYALVEWKADSSWDAPDVQAAVAEITQFFDEHAVTGRGFSMFDLVQAAAPLSAEQVFAFVPEEVRRGLVCVDQNRLLVASLIPDAGREVMLPMITDVRGELERLGARYPALQFHVTGTDVVARSHIHAMITDLARSLGFASFVIFGAICWAFRSWRFGLASVLPNVLPLVVVGGLLQLSGRSLEISSAVVFSVLLGLAVDDTIHFLSRWRDEQDHPLGPLRPTMAHVGKAITWTTIVLVAGLSITLSSSVPTTRWFATLCITGLVTAWVGDLILLPALMAFRLKRSPKSPS